MASTPVVKDAINHLEARLEGKFLANLKIVIRLIYNSNCYSRSRIATNMTMSLYDGLKNRGRVLPSVPGLLAYCTVLVALLYGSPATIVLLCPRQD